MVGGIEWLPLERIERCFQKGAERKALMFASNVSNMPKEKDSGFKAFFKRQEFSEERLLGVFYEPINLEQKCLTHLMVWLVSSENPSFEGVILLGAVKKASLLLIWILFSLKFA